jgi:hypothetical protein
VALLLPSAIFSPYAKNREVTFATVRDLADKFQTSLTATAIRLVELASFPAMIVCTDNGRRRWFIRGPDVSEVLWPRERPSQNTVASDLLQGKAMPSGSVDVCADGWLDHPDAGRYAVREDSRKIGEDLILSILWWKDERQLLDLDEDEEDAEEE